MSSEKKVGCSLTPSRRFPIPSPSRNTPVLPRQVLRVVPVPHRVDTRSPATTRTSPRASPKSFIHVRRTRRPSRQPVGRRNVPSAFSVVEPKNRGPPPCPPRRCSTRARRAEPGACATFHAPAVLHGDRSVGHPLGDLEDEEGTAGGNARALVPSPQVLLPARVRVLVVDQRLHRAQLRGLLRRRETLRRHRPARRRSRSFSPSDEADGNSSWSNPDGARDGSPPEPLRSQQRLPRVRVHEPGLREPRARLEAAQGDGGRRSTMSASSSSPAQYPASFSWSRHEVDVVLADFARGPQVGAVRAVAQDRDPGVDHARRRPRPRRGRGRSSG